MGTLRIKIGLVCGGGVGVGVENLSSGKERRYARDLVVKYMYQVHLGFRVSVYEINTVVLCIGLGLRLSQFKSRFYHSLAYDLISKLKFK